MANTLIASTNFPTASSSAVFTAIPDSFRQLMIIWWGRSISGSGLLQFNSLTSSYYNKGVRGSNNTVNSTTGVTNGVYLGETAIASGFMCSGLVDIPFYTESNFKGATIRGAYMRTSDTDYYIYVGGGVNTDTDPITSLTFTTTNGSNFVAGTRVDLYGID